MIQGMFVGAIIAFAFFMLGYIVGVSKRWERWQDEQFEREREAIRNMVPPYGKRTGT